MQDERADLVVVLQMSSARISFIHTNGYSRRPWICTYLKFLTAGSSFGTKPHSCFKQKSQNPKPWETCYCRRQRQWVWQQFKQLKVGCSYRGIVLTCSYTVLLQWCLRKTGWRTCFKVTSFPIIHSTFWQAQLSFLAVLLLNSLFPEQHSRAVLPAKALRAELWAGRDWILPSEQLRLKPFLMHLVGAERRKWGLPCFVQKGKA